MGCRQLALGVLVLLPSTGVLAFLPLLLGALLGEKNQPVLLGRTWPLCRGEASGHPVSSRDVQPHWCGLSPPGPGASLHFATSSITRSLWPQGVPRSTLLLGPGCDHSGLHSDSLGLWLGGPGPPRGLDSARLCRRAGPCALLVPRKGGHQHPPLPIRAKGPFPSGFRCTPRSRPPEGSPFLSY